ncbi:isoleucyl-tRNA synthetase, cytoplasmic, putative, partial [Perkinsus marinus ATCC 50983]
MAVSCFSRRSSLGSLHYSGRRSQLGISRTLITQSNRKQKHIDMKYTFEPVVEKPSFPKEEEKVLAFWDEIDAFHTSNKMSEGKPEYVFYDGPPFATGLPHYGHILAGTIKDVVTRYAHQTGHHVERRFGWDCHGLPVEHEIDKDHNIGSKSDVMKWGIANYNEACRSIVTRYTKEWREIVTRFGRWIDFDNDYKTMDRNFMETVWWVFKQLFDKGLVYRAFRVMPYSTALCTPLSNFEVAQGYKDVSDPSIIVAFPRKDKENSYLLIWTTTPWTLPSNQAISVNPSFKYLRVINKKNGAEYIFAKDRAAWVYKCLKLNEKKDVEVEETLLGTELVGIPYVPPFDFFVKHERPGKTWTVLSADYVTVDSGTGLVHQSPGFGEDDYQTCVKNGIISKDGTDMNLPLDESGRFTEEVPPYKGMHVKEADKYIKEDMKKRGLLLHNGMEIHSYPHCWRSDTPLIYRAIGSWFIKVEEVRDQLLANNEKSTWVPRHVQEGRFKNWLADARDWGVSRNRYWGTPIPIWASDDYQEIVCIGSVAELEEYAGHPIPDIHRHFIDDIKIPSKTGRGYLHRVDEVFDCWFESGSMPYAQVHYPFENKEKFEENFPADFVAEGLDQTRGWFYTMTVIATHLFNQPAFKNLIVNGLILAADGKKMSKRLKNYPDPTEVFDRYGADAVRMYMCNSPVVRAEPLKFREEGVRDTVKEVFLPLYNAYRFLVQETCRFEKQENTKFVPDRACIHKSTNPTDHWIYATSQELLKYTRTELESYRLYTIVGKLVSFLDDLTNWYIRMNRDRMRGGVDKENTLESLNTLYDVMLNLTIVLAPITPFITEQIYQNLRLALPDGDSRKERSVHFVMMPDPDVQGLDPAIVTALNRVQTVVTMGRLLRDHRTVGLKTPLRRIRVIAEDQSYLDDIHRLENYVKDELNVK